MYGRMVGASKRIELRPFFLKTLFLIAVFLNAVFIKSPKQG